MGDGTVGTVGEGRGKTKEGTRDEVTDRNQGITEQRKEKRRRRRQTKRGEEEKIAKMDAMRAES